MKMHESSSMKMPWPKLSSDEEAEKFVEEADLSEFDFSKLHRVHYELRRMARE